jgi:hypothetical protein
MLETLNAFHTEGAHRVVIVTARCDHERADTILQLRRWIPGVDAMPLYMRADTDYRSAVDVKADILEALKFAGYYPTLAFDDSPAVCKMFREKGLVVADIRDGALGKY